VFRSTFQLTEAFGGVWPATATKRKSGLEGLNGALFFHRVPVCTVQSLFLSLSPTFLLLMKHLFQHLPKLAAIAAIALSMSSCNRAEYAMLPKTTPYHATYHGTAKPAPAPAVVVSDETPAQAETLAPVAEEKSTATAAVVTPAAAPVAAEKPATVAKAAPATAAPQKLRLAERIALNKVAKKLDKYAPKLQLKQKSETAEANAISGNLRTGLILLLVGALITILPGSIFSLIGGIIAIIGLVFIILWLLDQA
jgi:hypothetical protein